MTQYSYINNNTWGDIFGIDIKDLPLHLLYRLRFEKLVEALGNDPRVEDIICSIFHNQNYSNLSYIKKVPNLIKYTKIIKEYNILVSTDRFIKNRERSYHSAHDIMNWSYLDDANKLLELDRWVAGKYSIISVNNIDYEWINTKRPQLIDEMIVKNLKLKNMHIGYSRKPLEHMIANICAEKTDIIMNEIFKKDWKNSIKIHSLSNKNLSEKHIIMGLKILAKRKGSPIINVDITKAMLKKLPTITRLEVVEKLINNRVKIDISENDFRSLLFGSIIRYPDRVESAIKNFKYIQDKK